MEKAEFIRKWKELKEKQRLKAKYNDLDLIGKLVFKEVIEVIYLSFDITSSEQDKEDYRDRVLKVNAVIKKFNISGEADYDGIFGAYEYNAVFLTEVHKIIPIKNIELGILLEFPKKF